MKIGTIEILCQLGVRLHKTKYIEEAESSDKFVQKLSKELDNAKLLSIEQLNNDRLISFNFDRGNLIFEMFGSGNVVLVQEGKIISSYKNEKWSDREIKQGAEYSPPKNTPPSELEPSDRYIIVSLVKLPFGKDYCLEALNRLNIDEKTIGNKLSESELTKLKKELENIRDNTIPYGFYENEKLIEFALTKLSKYANAKEFPSFSELLDEFYSNLKTPNEKLEKLNRRLESQEQRLESLKEEEKENKAKADYIYEKYNEAEQIIELAKSGKEVKGKINKKEKSIEVEF